MSRWYPRRRALSRKPENVKRRLQRRFFNGLAALLIAGGYLLWDHWSTPPAPTPAPTPAPAPAPATALRERDEATIEALIAARRGNAMVTFNATVTRVLPDDQDGSRHQRFLARLASGEQVLVAHNIDLAPRIDALAAKDTVTVRGEFEWNDKGGVVHWTHHDPAGRHPGGWIEHAGRRFE